MYILLKVQSCWSYLWRRLWFGFDTLNLEETITHADLMAKITSPMCNLVTFISSSGSALRCRPPGRSSVAVCGSVGLYQGRRNRGAGFATPDFDGSVTYKADDLIKTNKFNSYKSGVVIKKNIKIIWNKEVFVIFENMFEQFEKWRP